MACILPGAPFSFLVDPDNLAPFLSASCMRQLYVAQVVSQIIVSFVACKCTRNRLVDGRRFSIALWEA
jgi:hypothetical protein